MASFLNRDSKSLVNHNIKKDYKLLLHISVYTNLNIPFFSPCKVFHLTEANQLIYCSLIIHINRSS